MKECAYQTCVVFFIVHAHARHNCMVHTQGSVDECRTDCPSASLVNQMMQELLPTAKCHSDTTSYPRRHSSGIQCVG